MPKENDIAPTAEQMAADIDTYPTYVPPPEVGYIGTLEPNFYCRGWNSKRQKYCKQRSGHNTDHTGQGRCKWHGKGGTLKHGKYSKVVRTSLREHLEVIQREGGDRTDLSDEVDMLRAITADFIDNYDQTLAALIEWNQQDAIEARQFGRKPRPTKIPDLATVAMLLKDIVDAADKMHKQRHRDAIPKKDFFRIQETQGEIVRNRLRELIPYAGESRVTKTIDKISDDWENIRL